MNLSGERNVPGAPGNFWEGEIASRPNPMIDPRFKIKGGEPWNKTPLLPGKETKEFNERPIPYPMQFQLPGAMLPAGNVGGLLAQAVPQQPMQQPYGGSPNSQLTPEEKARLLQRGAPPPTDFREKYLPKAELPTGFQSKFVS